MTAIRQPPAATSDLDRARALLADDPDEMDEQWLAEIIAAVRAEAVAAERERCAKIAENGCLVPPDGGSPTEDEVEMCKSIAAFIRHGSDECMP